MRVEDAIPEQVMGALAEITGQTDNLSHLIDQLLEITQLDAGKLALHRQPKDLSSLVARVVAAAQASADLHVFTLAIPEATRADVDPLRLEQLPCNLLSNAVKYSPGGGSIDVSLSRPAPELVELSVRDHGLGVPPEKREHLFQRFYQAHGDMYSNGLDWTCLSAGTLRSSTMVSSSQRFRLMEERS